MNSDSIEGMGPVGSNGPQPVMIPVPIGGMQETDLLGALDFIANHWLQWVRPNEPEQVARAARWFHDKYGETP